ncbi:MAG: 30S ribosome-binding factor RbfA [Candidatus Omnitrophica bacterium]|nr:30S ribosome-binding factor RbfA [Candidatus Omnitrophota bacterium]
MDRTKRINEMIKREIGVILLTEIRDPRLKFVTVTGVEVSKDLQHAKVFYSYLGSDRDGVSEALEKARGFVRLLVGQRVIMRYTPDIQFYYDKSIEYSDRIEQTLENIKRREAGENVE